jgi:hypothetical protein
MWRGEQEQLLHFQQNSCTVEWIWLANLEDEFDSNIQFNSNQPRSRTFQAWYVPEGSVWYRFGLPS